MLDDNAAKHIIANYKDRPLGNKEGTWATGEQREDKDRPLGTRRGQEEVTGNKERTRTAHWEQGEVTGEQRGDKEKIIGEERNPKWGGGTSFEWN